MTGQQAYALWLGNCPREFHEPYWNDLSPHSKTAWDQFAAEINRRIEHAAKDAFAQGLGGYAR